MSKIEDWQTLINKPVLSIDEKEIGVVSDVQPLHIIVSSGPVTPNKYNIPKKSISKFENGVVYLSSSQKEVSDNHEFE
jgi:anthranilate/para-aminobenzoate synthase component II